MSEVNLGFNAAVYRLTSGTRATWGSADSSGIHGGAAPGSLSEITNICDELTLNGSSTEVDTSSRASDWKLTAQGLHDGSIEFTMIDDADDTDLAAIKAAHFSRSSIALAILNKEKTVVGADGLWADFIVSSFERKEGLDNKLMWTVTVKPTRSAVAPEWVVVSA